MAWLEALRFMTVALLLLTLANPEHVERIERDSEPEVLLFTDVSGSMSTRDVTDANGTTGVVEKVEVYSDGTVLALDNGQGVLLGPGVTIS